MSNPMASGWNATTRVYTTPEWLDSGDNSWQLSAATFVAFQSIPGLLLLWGGIVPKRWAINSAFMALYAFAATMICWVIFGYKAAFGESILGGLWGRPGPVLSTDYLLSQAYLPASGTTSKFPMSTYIYFQFVFAAITQVILSGAVLGRMNVVAWFAFVPLWLLFSYTVVAFSFWGGGWAYQWGVMDFAGGYVIHLSSGTAGLVASYWIGPRLSKDRVDFRPHNILMVLAGTGLLWTGWSGFNGGAPSTASSDAGLAVLNTHVTTATSMLSSMMWDVIMTRKPSVFGCVNGIVCGLVAITPCAGFIDGWAAILLGVLSGSIPWIIFNMVGRQPWFTRYFDDALGVFHTHGVAGLLGGIYVGIFATAEGSKAFGEKSPGGAIVGNGRQVGLQVVGALFTIGWNIVWTSLICLFIQYVLRIPLRMPEADLLIGDEAVHAETAYHLVSDEQPPVSQIYPGDHEMDHRHKEERWHTQSTGTV